MSISRVLSNLRWGCLGLWALGGCSTLVEVRGRTGSGPNYWDNRTDPFVEIQASQGIDCIFESGVVVSATVIRRDVSGSESQASSQTIVGLEVSYPIWKRKPSCRPAQEAAPHEN